MWLVAPGGLKYTQLVPSLGWDLGLGSLSQELAVGLVGAPSSVM